MGRALALAVALAFASAGARAEDAPPAAEPPAYAEGRRLFAESVAWVGAGRADLDRVTDLFLDLSGLEMALEAGGRHQGDLRVWYRAPDKFRWALRHGARDPWQIKLLDGDRMWLSTPRRLSEPRRWRSDRSLGPEAADALGQLRADRDRIVGLARFLALGSLAGRGVRFEFLGVVTHRAHLDGTWAKVRRHAPDGERLTFLLAGARDAGGTWRATHPHAVLQPGEPTRHVVLRRWRRGPRGAHPRMIHRYRREADGTWRETMAGYLEQLRINAGVPDARFRPEGGAQAE